MRQVHPFAPVCDGHSRILILGSFPSEKSRQTGFYYGHPRNRFWKILTDVTGEDFLGIRASDMRKNGVLMSGSGKNGVWAADSEAILTSDRDGWLAAYRRARLLQCGIALYDVCASCDITDSSDATIRGVVPNDLTPILTASRCRAVFTNGKTADRYYRRYEERQTGIEAVCLPSTSPANAACSYDRLLTQWEVIRQFLTADDAGFANQVRN